VAEITVTLLDVSFATHTCVPAGFAVIPTGVVPTVTVATTALVVRFTTLTVPDPPFETKAVVPTTATSPPPLPTPINVGVRFSVQTWPPLAEWVVSVAVTVYPMTGAPPLVAGAVQVTVACVDAFETADAPLGAPGVVDTVIGMLFHVTAPVPTTFVADTLNS
jgi:hypothetical protein